MAATAGLRGQLQGQIAALEAARDPAARVPIPIESADPFRLHCQRDLGNGDRDPGPVLHPGRRRQAVVEALRRYASFTVVIDMVGKGTLQACDRALQSGSARTAIRLRCRSPMKVAIEIIGWAGAALILGAYALLSAGKLRAETLTYHVMNILGAAGFVINSGWNGALPSAAMNVVWIGIGVYAVAQLRKRPQDN
jgi:hypothetical protein